MRILVTGAAGFIGSHLCRRSVAEGHDVVGFDDLSAGDLAGLADVPEVRFEQGDLRDAGSVRRAATGCAVILHQGARRSVPHSIREPEPFVDVNVRGTLNVLLAARDVGAMVVFASSSSVYGEQETSPFTEDLLPRPRSPYAATKDAGEALMRAWWHSYAVPTVSLRYFNVYGPYQRPSDEHATVIERFVTACLAGHAPVIHGDGEQARDCTYIDDAVEATLLAARARERGRGLVLNVGSGREPTTVNRILELVAEAAGVAVRPRYAPSREGDVRHTHADVSLARAAIGYVPRVSVDEGIRRTVAWFASRLAEGGIQRVSS